MDNMQSDPRIQAAVRRREKRRAFLNAKLSILTIFVLVPIFGLITLFLLLFPRPEISELENRTLEKFPKFSLSALFNGDFTTGITKYYDDTVPYRDTFKNIGNQSRSLFGLSSSKNTVTFVNSPKVVSKVNDEPSEQTQTQAPTEATLAGGAGRRVTEPTTATEAEDQKDFTAEEADGGWNNGILSVYQDGHWRCMELFGGGSGTNYAEALNRLQTEVGSGVTIYSMPAPLSCEFYLPSNYAEYSSSQSKCFDGVAQKLNPGIVSINICDELARHTEENIYCRTDHHWQSLGAYYAAKKFTETAGVPFADISLYEKGVNEGYVGTMYAFSKDPNILNDPEDFVYYTPTCDYTAHYYNTSFHYLYSDDLFASVDTSNSYLMYMGGDSYVVKVDTNVHNNRKLLVIKDSYGNAEIPFYTSSFEQVFVADMRYFECNLVNFIREMGITDVLFTMSSYSVVGNNADNLINLITQDPNTQIIDGQLSENSVN